MKQFYLSLIFIGWMAGAAQAQDASIVQNPIVKALTDSTVIGKKKGTITYLKPIGSIDTYYLLYVGANLNILHRTSNEKIYSAKHTFGLNYSITENSFSPYYLANFPHVIGNWNLSLSAGYDQTRRLNFFGIGNKSKRLTDSKEFYRFRTRNQYAGIGIDKFFNNRHHLDLSLLYNAIEIKNQDGHFLSGEEENLNLALLNWRYFLSPQLTYSYMRLNEQIIPTKSFDITTALSYNDNLTSRENSFLRLTSDMNLYLPLPKPFSIHIHAGGATLNNTPAFYQLNSIGGTTSLRGYERFRFYGKTTFFNQNELRWIPYVNGHYYFGHVGLLALFDQGRVWQPGEISDKIHTAYGAGIILSPFNKATVTATYAISNEERIIHLQVGKIF